MVLTREATGGASRAAISRRSSSFTQVPPLARRRHDQQRLRTPAAVSRARLRVTDGCKGQYKGRKNFARIAEFPSLHNGVQLLHRFTASHHFKGPHDQYGKDAKMLTRVAEKNKKRRLPGTYDWYDFLATEMAAPSPITTAPSSLRCSREITCNI